MSAKRRRFSPEFKARIVVEMLKEEKSHGELSAEHGIHIQQMRRWKDTVIEQLPQLFERGSKKEKEEKEEQEQKIENLYKEIGQLTTELSWLKKKSSYLSS
jgi:transposase-like protein